VPCIGGRNPAISIAFLTSDVKEQLIIAPPSVRSFFVYANDIVCADCRCKSGTSYQFVTFSAKHRSALRFLSARLHPIAAALNCRREIRVRSFLVGDVALFCLFFLLGYAGLRPTIPLQIPAMAGASIKPSGTVFHPLIPSQY